MQSAPVEVRSLEIQGAQLIKVFCAQTGKICRIAILHLEDSGNVTADEPDRSSPQRARRPQRRPGQTPNHIGAGRASLMWADTGEGRGGFEDRESRITSRRLQVTRHVP